MVEAWAAVVEAWADDASAHRERLAACSKDDREFVRRKGTGAIAATDRRIEETDARDSVQIERLVLSGIGARWWLGVSGD